MGWWTDLKHAAEKALPAVEGAVDVVIPGGGQLVKQLGDVVGALGDGVRDANDAAPASQRAPAPPPPPTAVAIVAPANQRAGGGAKVNTFVSKSNIGDINGNETWQVLARAQLGKWLPSEIPTLNSDAIHELAQPGGKAPTYPGLIWDGATQTYKPDPKGTPVIKTVVYNGREMTESDAAWLAARDGDAAPVATSGGAAMAKKRRIWMWVGGGAAAVGVLALLWRLSSGKKKA